MSGKQVGFVRTCQVNLMACCFHHTYKCFPKAIPKNKGRRENMLCVVLIHLSDANTPTMAKFNPYRLLQVAASWLWSSPAFCFYKVLKTILVCRGGAGDPGDFT